jgi:hypothetical protein
MYVATPRSGADRAMDFAESLLMEIAPLERERHHRQPAERACSLPHDRFKSESRENPQESSDPAKVDVQTS